MIARAAMKQTPRGAPTMTAGTSYSTPTVSHATIFTPAQADVNAYNHGAKLFRLPGSSRIYLLWATGARHEDAGGTYIVGVYSDDEGANWSARFDVCAAFEATDLNASLDSHVCVMLNIVSVGSRSFILGEIQAITWAAQLQTSRTNLGFVALEITGGNWGAPKWINGSGLSLAAWASADLSDLYLALSAPGYPGGGLNLYRFPKIANNSPDNLIECGVYQCPAGWLRIGRGYDLKAGASLSSFIYTQFSGNGGVWSTEQVTSIPNAPSAVAVLKMSSGKFVIVWNPDSDRNKLTLGVGTDGLNFASTYTVRGGTGTTPTYAGAYKAGGAAYPSLIELNDGRLLVAYSIKKETIAVSIVTVP